MPNLSKSTKPISKKQIKRDWHIIDVKGKILGRVIPEIAKKLQGKHKTNYVQYLDMGDNVVVINAKKVVLTGKKNQTKIYSQFSGYPGGLKTFTFRKLLEKNPSEIIKRGVSGMLPKNKLRNRRLARLYIFPGEEHPYKDNLKQQMLNVESKS